jgi:hypothetical protein
MCVIQQSSRLDLVLHGNWLPLGGPRLAILPHLQNAWLFQPTVAKVLPIERDIVVDS